MRLTCPDCGAQYDVSDDAIPAEGRDVECSNCGHSWFQAAAVVARPETDVARADHPVRRAVDASVAEILRAEAAHEQQLRAQETPEPTPPDAAESAPVQSPAAPQAAEPKMPVVVPARVTPQQKPDEPDNSNPRDMPSMTEINTSLRARSAERIRPTEPEMEEAVSRHGFRRGFALVLLVFAILFAPYVFAEQITAAFPQMQDTMATYVTMVDGWRLSLNAGVTALGERVAGLIG